jgi:ubiquitin carboxyl-terminal hydrolase 8
MFVLTRSMTSAKLEDSLSLSTEKQRQAFAERHKVDLVVVYDSRSSSWPQSSQATPLSRLWNTIYEHEFSKRLERTPVLLEGGFAAWREFIKMRVAKHTANGHLPRSSSKQVQANGYGPSPLYVSYWFDPLRRLG